MPIVSKVQGPVILNLHTWCSTCKCGVVT